MAYCTKKKHKNKWDAIIWQQVNNDNSPFYAYQCSRYQCNSWHISLSGYKTNIHKEAVEIIQHHNKNGKAILVKKLTNRKSIFKIHLGPKVWLVTYNKKQKNISEVKRLT